MKKLWIILALMMLLSGCSAAPTFETISDDHAGVQTALPGKLRFAIPEDASAQVLQSDAGTVYFCDGYEITVQTFCAGDINSTIQQLTGYTSESITVMETEENNVSTYACAWICAGENGDHIGRSLILDDGQYHYCLSVMAHAQEAGSLLDSWQELFSSAALDG